MHLAHIRHRCPVAGPTGWRQLRKTGDRCGRTKRGSILLIAALLLAPPAWSAEVPSLVETPRTLRLGPGPTTGRKALLLTSEIAAVGAIGVASYFSGSAWASANFAANGRPDPRVVGGSIAISLAVNMALTWLLLPELSRMTNDDQGKVDIGFVRRETWRVTRWFALAGLVFVGVLVTGALIEHQTFGNGQAVMLVGAAGSAATALSFDIAALFTANRATRISHQMSEVGP